MFLSLDLCSLSSWLDADYSFLLEMLQKWSFVLCILSGDLEWFLPISFVELIMFHFVTNEYLVRMFFETVNISLSFLIVLSLINFIPIDGF